MPIPFQAIPGVAAMVFVAVALIMRTSVRALKRMDRSALAQWQASFVNGRCLRMKTGHTKISSPHGDQQAMFFFSDDADDDIDMELVEYPWSSVPQAEVPCYLLKKEAGTRPRRAYPQPVADAHQPPRPFATPHGRNVMDGLALACDLLAFASACTAAAAMAIAANKTTGAIESARTGGARPEPTAGGNVLFAPAPPPLEDDATGEERDDPAAKKHV